MKYLCSETLIYENFSNIVHLENTNQKVMVYLPKQ